MGLMSAVYWWEESQLRVLVLGSLVVQFLLLIFSIVRTYDIPGWFRSMMWLAYLAGDALAIYALATLFNRHKQNDGDLDPRGGGILEVVWAPILLIHLGGHDGISAYNIEDNELWSRHLVTAVSQVTVAIYVFYKSWEGPGGDRRLLQAGILLFVPGVLKCFTKPWALKRARASIASSALHLLLGGQQNKMMARGIHSRSTWKERGLLFENNRMKVRHAKKEGLLWRTAIILRHNNRNKAAAISI